MSRLVDIPLFIESIVENLAVKVMFKSITELDGVFTVVACNTKNINKGKVITVNGLQARVINFVKDQSFTFKLLSGTLDPLSINSITVDPFNFFHGTVIKTKEELDNTEYPDRTPLVWLYAVFNQSEISRETSNEPHNSEATLRVFILDETNYTDYLTEDHHREVIRPVKAYYEEFIQAIRKSPLVHEVGTVQITDHANWGIYVEGKGHTEQIFNDDLSGIEIQLPLKLYKENCTC